MSGFGDEICGLLKDDHMTCLDKFNSRSDKGQDIKTLSKILGWKPWNQSAVGVTGSGRGSIKKRVVHLVKTEWDLISAW